MNKRDKRLFELHDDLNALMSGESTPSRKGYNDEAKKLRGVPRKTAKRQEPDQVISEEELALDLGKDRKFALSKDGENLANDVVNVPFWKKLF